MDNFKEYVIGATIEYINNPNIDHQQLTEIHDALVNN